MVTGCKILRFGVRVVIPFLPVLVVCSSTRYFKKSQIENQAESMSCKKLYWWHACSCVLCNLILEEEMKDLSLWWSWWWFPSEFLECLNSPFCQPICRRVMGGTGRVISSILLRKLLNSTLVITDPLSDTINSCNPCVANSVLRCSVVSVDVAVLFTLIYIHLEYASTITKNIQPNRNPA